MTREWKVRALIAGVALGAPWLCTYNMDVLFAPLLFLGWAVVPLGAALAATLWRTRPVRQVAGLASAVAAAWGTAFYWFVYHAGYPQGTAEGAMLATFPTLLGCVFTPAWAVGVCSVLNGQSRDASPPP